MAAEKRIVRPHKTGLGTAVPPRVQGSAVIHIICDRHSVSQF